MLHTGEVIENTQSRERVKIRTGQLDTAGALVEADFLLRAGGAVAAAHVHPYRPRDRQRPAVHAHRRPGRRHLGNP
jgi:hypothetical protein